MASPLAESLNKYDQACEQNRCLAPISGMPSSKIVDPMAAQAMLSNLHPANTRVSKPDTHSSERLRIPQVMLLESNNVCTEEHEVGLKFQGSSPLPSVAESWLSRISDELLPNLANTAARIGQPKVPHGFAPEPPPARGTSGLQTQKHIQVPEMLSRFLTVDRLNDSLRYEAGIAISEGRVHDGEDIVERKLQEGDWQWNMASLSAMSSSEWNCSIEANHMEENWMEGGGLEEDGLEDIVRPI